MAVVAIAAVLTAVANVRAWGCGYLLGVKQQAVAVVEVEIPKDGRVLYLSAVPIVPGVALEIPRSYATGVISKSSIVMSGEYAQNCPAEAVWDAAAAPAASSSNPQQMRTANQPGAPNSQAQTSQTAAAMKFLKI
ncbi:hypothetical protein RHMOL_Rhmol04G0262100 [Rhododendron molle]|uniref:Uncharacterized protein n=1 Tax=Rhododendron molle TaxID=49168 RepID=A0ACC0P4C2_RHOML|nr:hypothetical protein RHMOL_Rhmol04G0262100 [Rhododendron molle]